MRSFFCLVLNYEAGKDEANEEMGGDCFHVRIAL